MVYESTAFVAPTDRFTASTLTNPFPNSFSVSQETRMPAWKILVVLLFAMACIGLAFATLIVPLAMSPEDGRWYWFAGLLFATIVMGVLFGLFLRNADRTFKR